MPATLAFPFQTVDGPLSALVLLFALVIGHAFADFPLQGDFLALGKNRHLPPPKLADGRKCPKHLWAYLMSAHCFIHAGFVWLISGVVILAVVEFVFHFVIDVMKCENITSFETDQWLHILTKVLFVVLLWAGVV